MALQIVVMADTHSKHDQIEAPKGDILIHAGDATGFGGRNQFECFCEYFTKLPHKYKVLIAGNHDPCFEKYISEIPTRLPNVHYLVDESVVIEGIKIYGTPWTPCHWAYHTDQDKLIDKWRQIPNDVDLLVTHMPPAKILDFDEKANKHEGCPQLAEQIKQRIKPQYHVFGHVHTQGIYKSNHTVFINAAVTGGEYKVQWQPFSFTWQERK